MSGLRDFVTGSDACTASDGAGPSNAMGTLVNSLLGTASKTQEQLRELPVVQPQPLGHPGMQFHPEASTSAFKGISIPGLAPQNMVHADVNAFLQGQHPVPSIDEFENIYNDQVRQLPLGPGPGPATALPGPPPVLQQQFRAFLDSGRMKAPFHAPPLPGLALPLPEQCRIRDRATILSRHIYSDMGEGYADQQVNHLLASLSIDPAQLPAELPHAHDAHWHDVWKSATAHPPEQMAAADMAAAAREMDAVWQQSQQRHHPPSTGWAEEFAQVQHPGQAWAGEFSQEAGRVGEEWAQEMDAGKAGVERVVEGAGDMAQTSARLAETLAKDPKMQQSKFLQFLSKMSKGELLVEDNKVVERPAEATAWASEFKEMQHAANNWSEEFEQHQAARPGGLAGDWVEDFAKRVADVDIAGGDMEAAWREAAAHTGGEGAEEYRDRELEEVEAEWERIYSAHAPSTSQPGEYVFAQDNPFLGDPQALQKGKQLFKEGLLTEAALALEAEVQANPGSVQAWRLLGTVQAENDDDRQAIAALGKAHEADPNNSDVLLALGVSHTNELDQGRAVNYLGRWLQLHPTYQHIATAAGPPPDSSQATIHLVRQFERAAQEGGSDAEVLLALGVLQHLARQYDRAVGAFDRALEARPQDYSLWNKLGATLANHSRSEAAIQAYRRALELKPNYMRAWTNMGISYANIGDYDQSARYYIRALEMNPKASHVWGYLRTTLSCAGRHTLLEAVDNEDLATLSRELPLV